MTHPYDKATLARLTASHGAERTKLIAAGLDAATNRDLAAWRRLGSSNPLHRITSR